MLSSFKGPGRSTPQGPQSPRCRESWQVVKSTGREAAGKAAKPAETARNQAENRRCAKVAEALERIVIGRNRSAVSSDHVNPLYTMRIDQIHKVDGTPKAIPERNS